MAKKPHDNGRKDKLITSRRILIDIYDGQDKVRRKINRKSLKKG